MQQKQFSFKPVTEYERDPIEVWLAQDYIAEWVHGQGLKNLLNGLDKFIEYQTHNPSHKPDMLLTQHWLGYDNKVPVVYLLTNNIFKTTENEYTKYAETNGPFITLDIFIINKEYVGKGYASQIIKEFLLTQYNHITEVFIDPEQTNSRAIHVYKKVGFKIVGEFIASWHPVPHYIMRLSMKDMV